MKLLSNDDDTILALKSSLKMNQNEISSLTLPLMSSSSMRKSIKSRKSLQLDLIQKENESSDYSTSSSTISSGSSSISSDNDSADEDNNDSFEKLDRKLKVLNDNFGHNRYDWCLEPKKSCLPNRSFSQLSPKKQVSFADSHGRQLEQVRTISEPSNCPPKLNSKSAQYFLNKEYLSTNPKVNNELYVPLNSNESNKKTLIIYTLNFEQPAGDYLNFQDKINRSNVSLENVILNRFNVSGTIKAKNICFEKNVFVRCTFNSWKTYKDIKAEYVPSQFESNQSNFNTTQADTFKFEFNLPNEINTDDEKTFIYINEHQRCFKNVEFCVCFMSADSQTYWDSNNGQNYSILKYALEFSNTNVSFTTTEAKVTSKISSSLTSSSLINNNSIKLSTNLNDNAYLRSIVQEQTLNTIIDKFFYNWLASSTVTMANTMLNQSTNSINDFNNSTRYLSDFNSVPYW